MRIPRPEHSAACVALASALALVGCRRADAARTSLGDPGVPVAAAAPSIEPQAQVPVVPRLDPRAELPDPCVAGASLTRGTREITTDDGRARSVVLDAPDDADLAGKSAPRPLLLAFHGWGGSPEQMERTTRIAEAATARGFVVVRPLGVGKSFNAGTCCGAATESTVDDVALARSLVEAVARETCVDRARVFATGFSNGGFLAHRLGCEASDVFAAVASVSGTFGVDACTPARPVPVLQIHGGADRIVKFAGVEEKGWSSVGDVVARWRAIDHCTNVARETFRHGDARCTTYDACADHAEVTLCRVEHAGHTWPGGPKSTGYGGTQDLDATTTILDFFAAHPARLAAGL